MPNQNLNNLDKASQKIINFYEESILKIRELDRQGNQGQVREKKGKLGEEISKKLILDGWKILGGSKTVIEFRPGRFKLPIYNPDEYVSRFSNETVKNHILENSKKYYATVKQDISIFIRNKFCISVECKAYAENAMFKRILTDAMLVKRSQNNASLKFILIQLESQLTGDYSDPCNFNILGSKATHSYMSYFDVYIEIITLLEGDRKPKKEIHKEEFYKPMKKEAVLNAFKKIIEILKNFL